MNPKNYPPAIVAFLRDERLLLDLIGKDFPVLVEVGSMRGLAMEWAASRGVRYLGMDIVPYYVAAGNRASRRWLPGRPRPLFVQGDASRLPAAVRPYGRLLSSGGMIFFPFNSFGNMPDFRAVTAGLAAVGAPFLISSYGTSAEATAARAEYYSGCDYGRVSVRRTSRGVRFSAGCGLDSIAYHPDFLVRRFRSLGLSVSCLPFGRIGAAYFWPGRSGSLPPSGEERIPDVRKAAPAVLEMAWAKRDKIPGGGSAGTFGKGLSDGRALC